MRRQRNLLGPQGMGGMVSLWGASSLIKSIQRGTITLGSGVTTGTATIAAVDTANAFVTMLGMSQSQANANFAVGCERVTLTNSTTVTVNIGANAGDAILSYEVIEYLPGVVKSVQRGTISMAGNASATATITEVNTAKSFCLQLGFSHSSLVTPTADQHCTKTVFTNATTLTASRATADANNPITTSYQVLEFF